MKIDRHISELLSDYDCVIVPGMGGFIVSNHRVRVGTEQQSPDPASKKIIFNIFLTHNDGLLAEHISRNENINLNEALKKIKEYVHQYHQEIDSGGKFSIEQVGVFYADEERNIHFDSIEKTNYLKDSFEQMEVHSLSPEKEIFKSGSQIKNGENISFDVKTKNKNRKSLSGNLLNKVLLAGGIFWLLLNVYSVVPVKKNFAPSPINRDSELNMVGYQSSILSPQSSVGGNKPAESVSKDSVQPTTASSSEHFLNKKSGNNFYIVAGAFRSIENAIRCEGKLKSQGFSKATIIDSTTSLKMVSYGGYASRETAAKELNRLNAEKKEGWIYPH